MSVAIVLSIQASTRVPAATSAATLSTAGASVWTAAEPRERPPLVRAIIFGEVPLTALAETPAPLRTSIHTPRLAGEGASSSR
jgi:hypothetical protein